MPPQKTADKEEPEEGGEGEFDEEDMDEEDFDVEA